MDKDDESSRKEVKAGTNEQCKQYAICNMQYEMNKAEAPVMMMMVMMKMVMMVMTKIAPMIVMLASVLATAATLGNHVRVLLEDDVVSLVVVEEGDGFELRGDAAGTSTSTLEFPTEGGDNGVVGGGVVRLEREGAAAVARASLVA